LLKTAWDTFSGEQQAVMKMVYGLPLSHEDMAIWHALHGGGVFDDLYRLVGVRDSGVPYVEGREYNDITLIIGRRAAKSCISSFLLVYEALCGGHKSRLINQDQDPVFLQVAQDLGRAMTNMREYILHYIKSSPAGLSALGDMQKSVTQRSIRLAGCGIIKVGPPNIKVGRGDSVAFFAADETAYWAKDERSASPDYEVERAVIFGMSQFYPYAKRVKTSTPWTEEGLLWDDAQIGTHGRFVKDDLKRRAITLKLVLQGPSPVLNNPTITEAFLLEKKASDSDAFVREIGAEFAKSVSGYLPAALVRRAITPDVTKRAPVRGAYYIAAIDPAFRNDAFPLCIGHMGADGQFVQDLLTSWRGTPDAPLNPGLIMPMVGALCAEYGINSVMSDQHHLESLQSLAQDAGFSIEPFVLTAKVKTQVWSDFLTLLNQDKVQLLDHIELQAELLALERHLTSTGTVRIQGRRDDHAIVTAMCLHRALNFGVTAEKDDRVSEPTTAAGIRAVLAQRHAHTKRPAARAAWWLR
jgi:hypothetical protein